MSINIHRIYSKKIIEYIIITLILVFGIFVRFYAVNSPIADWHSFRQADTASVTRTYVDNGIDFLNPRYHDISTIQSGLFNPNGYRYVEFPIFNFFHAILTKNIPILSLELWGRLLSIFSAILSATVIYILGKKVSNPQTGLLAAFFYLALPYNIYFTRVILPEPLAVTFALISLLLFLEFTASDKIRFLLLSGFCLSIALLTKPFLVFYTIPMLYLFINRYGYTSVFKRHTLVFHIILFGLISLLPLLLWRLWISRHPEGIPFYTWLLNGDGIRFKPSFWRWIFSERLGNLILGIWGLIPFSFGFMTTKKNYFNLFFLLGMFLYVTVVATANVRHDYYQIICIPAISLGLADGSVYLWNSVYFNKLFSRILLVGSIALMLITAAIPVKEFYKIDHPEIISAGNEVQKLTPKNSLVIAPYNGDTAFLYQTDRWGWPYVDRPINEMISEGADYYVSVNFDDQTDGFITKFETIEKTGQFVILDLHKPISL